MASQPGPTRYPVPPYRVGRLLSCKGPVAWAAARLATLAMLAGAQPKQRAARNAQQDRKWGNAGGWPFRLTPYLGMAGFKGPLPLCLGCPLLRSI